jgi:hypothetical protein
LTRAANGQILPVARIAVADFITLGLGAPASGAARQII